MAAPARVSEVARKMVGTCMAAPYGFCVTLGTMWISVEEIGTKIGTKHITFTVSGVKVAPVTLTKMWSHVNEDP
jgi:hypothetical protein